MVLVVGFVYCLGVVDFDPAAGVDSDDPGVVRDGFGVWGVDPDGGLVELHGWLAFLVVSGFWSVVVSRLMVVMSDRLLVCRDVEDVPVAVREECSHVFGLAGGAGFCVGPGGGSRVGFGDCFVWQGRSAWLFAEGCDCPPGVLVVIVAGECPPVGVLEGFAGVGCRLVVVLGDEGEGVEVVAGVEVHWVGLGEWRTLTANDVSPVGVVL